MLEDAPSVAIPTKPLHISCVFLTTEALVVETHRDLQHLYEVVYALTGMSFWYVLCDHHYLHHTT